MKKILAVFAFLLGNLLIFSQNHVINGKIINPEQLPLENATVYLLKQKDSSIINYTSSGKEGGFKLKISNLNEASLLKIDHPKYAIFSKEFKNIDKDVEMGTLILQRNLESKIDEVKITAAPIKIKKDTIEFKASAIKVRPDAKIEELLKGIPGVEMDNDGKITINGKEVDKILVNGKPFFDKDGKIALKNLTADLIKNIQFTTTKTKEEELSGKTAKSENATINFNIDEKKNKGFLGRVNLGYGSDQRYEGSLLTSYFNKDSKVSLLSSANNINSEGFSNDEIFDSMGSGRNAWMLQGGNVSYSGGSRYYSSSSGAKKGIQKSSVLGVNYSDQFGKKVDLETMSVMVKNGDSETRSKVNRTTLLTDYTLNTQSENEGNSDSRQLSFDQSIVVKPDTLTSIYISPAFSTSFSKSISKNLSSTRKNGVLLNNNLSYSNSESLNNSFNNNIYITRKFKKKGRSFSLDANTNINQRNSDNLSISETEFFQGSGSNDNRNQQTKNKDNGYSYGLGISYTEPITDSVSLDIALDYSRDRNNQDARVHDFDAATGTYSIFNSALSNFMSKRTSSIDPNVSLNINKKKLNLWMGLDFNIDKMNIESEYQNEKFSLERTFFNPSSYFGMQYKFNETSRLSINNNNSFYTPSASQLSTFTNTSNPLVSYVGNPDLKNTWSNYTNVYFSKNNIQKGTNFYISSGFNYSNNAVAYFSTIDDSGKQHSTYTNISGNKSVRLSFGYSKTFKWNDNKSKLTISPRTSQSYSYSKGFINGNSYTSNLYTLSPGINFSFEEKDRFTIKPSYSLNYTTSKYDNYVIDQSEVSYNQFKLELTNYFFKSNLVIGNDFEYNTNSITQPGYKKDFYFWNTSIGYLFFDKQLTAKVKVYDVQNQNQSVSRSINSTYIEDREDLILKRYIMFSLSMKLNKFGGKK